MGVGELNNSLVCMSIPDLTVGLPVRSVCPDDAKLQHRLPPHLREVRAAGWRGHVVLVGEVRG